MGNAWTKYSDHLQNDKITVLDEAENVYPDAKTMIAYAKNRYLTEKPKKPFDIQPNYLIDKVTNWLTIFQSCLKKWSILLAFYFVVLLWPMLFMHNMCLILNLAHCAYFKG